MEKPSVTIKHPEAYVLGGMMMIFSLIFIFPAIAAPPEEKVGFLALVAVMATGSLLVMTLGSSVEIIDENGIYLKELFSERRYAWSDIVEVAVAKVHNRKSFSSYHPEIYITVKGGRSRREAGEQWLIRNMSTGIILPYQRKVWSCICYYYGAADFDEWGRLPDIT